MTEMFEVDCGKGVKMVFGLELPARRVVMLFSGDQALTTSISADQAQFAGTRLLEMAEKVRNLDALKAIKCQTK